MNTSKQDRLTDDFPEGERQANTPVLEALARGAHAASPTPAERARLDAAFRHMLAGHIDGRPDRAMRGSWLKQLLSGLLGVAVASAAWALIFVRTLPSPAPDGSPGTLTAMSQRSADTLSAEGDRAASGPMTNRLRPRAFDEELSGNADKAQRSEATSAMAVPPQTDPTPAPLVASPKAGIDMQSPQDEPGIAQKSFGGGEVRDASSNSFLGTLPSGIPPELPVYQITDDVPPQINASNYATITPEEALRTLLQTLENSEVRGPTVVYEELREGGALFLIPTYRFDTSSNGARLVRMVSAVVGISYPDTPQ